MNRVTLFFMAAVAAGLLGCNPAQEAYDLTHLGKPVSETDWSRFKPYDRMDSNTWEKLEIKREGLRQELVYMNKQFLLGDQAACSIMSNEQGRLIARAYMFQNLSLTLLPGSVAVLNARMEILLGGLGEESSDEKTASSFLESFNLPLEGEVLRQMKDHIHEAVSYHEKYQEFVMIETERGSTKQFTVRTTRRENLLIIDLNFKVTIRNGW